MTPDDYLELISKHNGEALYPIDMKEAIVGVGARKKGPICLLLDRDKCIEILQGQGMDEEEAIEFFEFNTAGAYMGESTPIFVTVEDAWENN